MATEFEYVSGELRNWPVPAGLIVPLAPNSRLREKDGELCTIPWTLT